MTKTVRGINNHLGFASYINAAASGCLVAGLAVCAMVSLSPYPIWGQQKIFYALVFGFLMISYIGQFRSITLKRHDIVLALSFSLFLIYISILPKIDGGNVRWFFLVPFTWTLLTINNKQRNRGFDIFFWLFSISLIPGIFLWLLLVFRVPIHAQILSHPNPGFAAAGAHYYKAFGALFLTGNVLPLPNGGLLSRLCSIYDEPGTVGTIAALCIAITGYRLRDIRCILAAIAGFMSFSLAFIILTFLGCFATIFVYKRPMLLILIILCLLASSIHVLDFNLSKHDEFNSFVFVLQKSERSDTTGPNWKKLPMSNFKTFKKKNNRYTKAYRLRPSKAIDNRSTMQMNEVFSRYLNGSARSIAFGLGSDASLVYAVTSSSWKSVLTNYGIIGFLWLFTLFFFPIMHLWRKSLLNMNVFIFCMLFALSFYQRPVIWLPGKMLIFFSALHYISNATKTPNQVVDSLE